MQHEKWHKSPTVKFYSLLFFAQQLKIKMKLSSSCSSLHSRDSIAIRGMALTNFQVS